MWVDDNLNFSNKAGLDHAGCSYIMLFDELSAWELLPVMLSLFHHGDISHSSPPHHHTPIVRLL